MKYFCLWSTSIVTAQAFQAGFRKKIRKLSTLSPDVGIFHTFLFFWRVPLKVKWIIVSIKNIDVHRLNIFNKYDLYLHSKHLKWKYNSEHCTWSMTSIEFYVTLFVDSLDVNIASVINTNKQFLVPNINENIVFLLGWFQYF